MITFLLIHCLPVLAPLLGIHGYQSGVKYQPLEYSNICIQYNVTMVTAIPVEIALKTVV